MAERCMELLASVMDTTQIVPVELRQTGLVCEFQMCFQRICQGYLYPERQNGDYVGARDGASIQGIVWNGFSRAEGTKGSVIG